MGFRFGKSIKLFGGLKLNLGTRGISTSLKVGKLNLNSKRGVSLGLGSGLSYHFGKGKPLSNTSIKRVTVKLTEEELEQLKKITGINTNIGSVRECLRQVINTNMKKKNSMIV